MTSPDDADEDRRFVKFLGELDAIDPAGYEEYLHRECDNPALIAKVLAAVAAELNDPDFLTKPIFDVATMTEDQSGHSAPLPEEIGRSISKTNGI